MKLGVISDTHDKLHTIDQAFDYFHKSGIQKIIHAGDWKTLETLKYLVDLAEKYSMTVYGVLGNNDQVLALQLEKLAALSPNLEIADRLMELAFDSKAIAVHHGHVPAVRRQLLSQASHDFVIFGHSHKPKIETNNHTTIVNPGSTAFSIPRSKTWRPSVAIIDTVQSTAEIIYLD